MYTIHDLLAAFNISGAGAPGFVNVKSGFAQSPLASSVNFFICDLIKVTLMLAVIVFGVAVVRTFIIPQRAKKWQPAGLRAWEM